MDEDVLPGQAPLPRSPTATAGLESQVLSAWAEPRPRGAKRSTVWKAMEDFGKRALFSVRLDRSEAISSLEELVDLSEDLLSEAAAQRSAEAVLRRAGRVARAELHAALRERVGDLLSDVLPEEDLDKLCEAALESSTEDSRLDEVRLCFGRCMSAVLERARVLLHPEPSTHDPSHHRNALPVVPLEQLAALQARPRLEAVPREDFHLSWRRGAAIVGETVATNMLCALLYGGVAYSTTFAWSQLLRPPMHTGSTRFRQRVHIGLTLSGLLFVLGYTQLFLYALWKVAGHATIASSQEVRSRILWRAGTLTLLICCVVIAVGEIVILPPFLMVAVALFGLVAVNFTVNYTLVQSSRGNLVRQAAVEARRLLRGLAPKRSVSIVHQVFWDSVPVIVISVLGVALAACASQVLSKADSVGKLLAFCGALVVKVAGNRSLNVAISRGMIRFKGMSADAALFNYELATGLLSRMLILSVPDPTIAVGTTLASTVVELVSRLGALHMHVVRGTDRGEWTEKEWLAYRRTGEVFVADSQGDQVVEFISSAAACGILLNICTGDSVSCNQGTLDGTQLIMTFGAQSVLELICDIFGACLEVHSGLGPHMRAHLAMQRNWRIVLTKAVSVYMVMSIVLIMLLAVP